MEFQHFIKIEQQSPISSTSNVMGQCMGRFFNEDSPDHLQNHHQDYFHESIIHHETILSHLQQVTDLRTTPLEEILTLVGNIFPKAPHINSEALRRMIIKRKNYLKRQFAKNWRFRKTSRRELYVFAEIPVEEWTQSGMNNEIKKKRNRMSAQISRDRKKKKIKQLESQNRRLKEESQRMGLENQKLKKYLEGKSEQQNWKPKENKSVQFLIVLGLLFLFYILKDGKINASKPEKTTTISADLQFKLAHKLSQIAPYPHQPFLQHPQSLQLFTQKLHTLNIDTQDIHVNERLKKQIQQLSNEVL